MTDRQIIECIGIIIWIMIEPLVMFLLAYVVVYTFLLLFRSRFGMIYIQIKKARGKLHFGEHGDIAL